MAAYDSNRIGERAAAIHGGVKRSTSVLKRRACTPEGEVSG